MNIREAIARALAPNLKTEDEIRAIVDEKIEQARMALPITADYDKKGEGYRPLTGQSNLRDLLSTSHERMIEVAYWMYDNSAMTRRLAHMDRGFLFDGRVTITADDGYVQEVIDAFWHDEDNCMDLSFPEYAMWLSLLGSQLWPVEINKINGHVRLLYIDPADIKEIHVSRADTRQIQRVDLKDSLLTGRIGKKYAVIRKDYNTISKTYGRLVGDAFYFAINKPPNAAYGRSDYLTLFDWIDSEERHGFNILERSEFLLNFIWDVTLKGMTEEEIRTWAKENGPPPAGSVRAHNENVDWKAVSPDLKSYEQSNVFDTIKGFVMGAAGRPDSWFGAGGKAYQTEAEQFGQVPLRDLGQRQMYLKFIVERLARFVVDQGVIHGRLTSERVDKAKITVTMPEISQKELTKLINGVPQLTTALSIAVQENWISKETATKIFAYVVSYLGYEIDVQKEIDAAGKKPPDDTKDYDDLVKKSNDR
ncbi:MAG: hypothetical protein JXA07_04125 [Spirochaetes bacterium]|nr:hypothetical protein [Spirochaetota bacterium]